MRGTRPNRDTLRHRVKRILILLLPLLVGSLLLLSLQIYRSTPTYDELQSIEQVEASRILSSDGELIGSWFHQNRSRIPLRQISPDFVEALLATEDIRYYEHNGIDYRSLLRVAVKTVLLQQDAGGGSTVTQQLVKNLYPRKGTGLLGLLKDKLREMLTARRMESLYSKTEILELYLNTVSFGEDTYGIETASRRYFGVSASNLELHQAALLAGLLRAPGAYNPRLYPERALTRRNVVLQQMEKYRMISQQERDWLEELPIDLNYQRISTSDGYAPHFREQLRKDLQQILQEIPGPAGRAYNLYTDGLAITTTLDLSLQKVAEQALSEQVQELQKRLDRSIAPGDSLPEQRKPPCWKWFRPMPYLPPGENESGPGTSKRFMTRKDACSIKENRMTRTRQSRYWSHTLQVPFFECCRKRWMKERDSHFGTYTDSAVPWREKRERHRITATAGSLERHPP